MVGRDPELEGDRRLARGQHAPRLDDHQPVVLFDASDERAHLLRRAVPGHRERLLAGAGRAQRLLAVEHDARLVTELLQDLQRRDHIGAGEQLPPLGDRVTPSLLTREPVRCEQAPEVAGATAGLPPGLRFDPGGIGKGLAADIVSSEAMARGAEGVCINIGGDLRVSGVAPSGGDWTIGVEHPRRSSPVVLLGLREGAVATSTTLRRAWRVGGRSVHHLIDPRTGAPSESPTVLATAVAASGWMAETLAKATLLRGEHPFDLVGGSDAEAIVVTHDGTVSASPGLQRFTGHAEPPVSILEEVAS